MSGLRITLDDHDVSAKLSALEKKCGDLTPYLKTLGAHLEKNVARRLTTTKTDPSGKKWAPWAKSTANARARENRGTLLVHRGHMLDSLTYQVPDRHTLLVGFGVPYAVYHEWGTKRMARRGLLTANPDTGEMGAADKAEVLGLLTEFLEP